MPFDLFTGGQRNADAFMVTRPGFGPGLDPSFGEAFGVAQSAAANTLRSLRVGASRYNAVQSWLDRFEEVSGYGLPNPEVGSDPAARRRAYAEIVKRYDALKAEKPGIDLPTPPTSEEADAAAIAEERRILGIDAAVRNRPQTFSSAAGSVLGDIAGLAIDPVNIASMALAIPRGAGILSTALRSALYGGGAQAVISSLSEGLQKEITPGYGGADVAAEIALAAVGGGILGGGLKGLAKAWGIIKARGARPVPAPVPAPVDAVPTPEPTQLELIPRTVRDAGNVVEREAVTADANPYRDAGPDGEVAHRQNLAEAEASIIEGRAPVMPEDQFAGQAWRPGRVHAPDGSSVGVVYQVVEADSLVTSHFDDLRTNPDYPAALQPRDRTRPLSADQIVNIAARLEPERLGPSADASNGAPVVGPDNLVESGNGRVLALRRAYGASGPQAEAYRAFLTELGFVTDDMLNPILIARRTTPLDEAGRVAFANAANRATALRLSATEQALADARLVDTALLETATDGKAFARGLIAKLPQSERGGLIDKRGVLSQEGERRAAAALLARAYDDPALLARALEAPEGGLKTIAGALSDTAADWAKMRDAVTSGRVPAGMDITADLLKAVRVVQEARDSGRKVAEIVDQTDFFEAPSPVARALLRLMFRNDALTQGASREAVARGLAGYAEEALKNTTDARLFGEPLTVGDVLGTALAKAGREDLLQAANDAVAPAAVEKRLADPVTDDAALHGLDQLGDDAVIPVRTVDEFGGETVTMKPVRAMIEEADAEIAAAKEIEACAVGLVTPGAA